MFCHRSASQEIRPGRIGTVAGLRWLRQNLSMASRECYHCKRSIKEGEKHDCWTTTEAALTQDLSDDLRDAWVRLRETAAAFGDQRIYASHKSIMFAKVLLLLVGPKRSFLELCVFRPHVEGPPNPTRRPCVENEECSLYSDRPPGRSRGADHGLASWSCGLGARRRATGREENLNPGRRLCRRVVLLRNSMG